MTAYMIVLLNNRNTHWLEEYIKHVPTIFRKFGGEYVGVSTAVTKIEGAGSAPQQVAIFSFPSTANIQAFMACDEYVPFKKSRQAHSDAEILMFEC